MEKEIRIGNDFNVEWSFFRDKEHTTPYDLTNKNVTLMITHRGESFTLPFYIDGNTIRFVFYGVDQELHGTGGYTASAIENKGQKRQIILDKINFIRLTSRSEEIVSLSEMDEDVENMTILLNSDISIPANGLSAYELALLEGFEGSLDEWLESLRGERGLRGFDGNAIYPEFSVNKATMHLVMDTKAAGYTDRFTWKNGHLILNI